MHSFKSAAIRLTAGALLLTTLTAPALALTGTVNAGGSSLRLRSQASTDSQILANLSDGTQVDVLSSAENGWYQVTFGELSGYVSSDYLQLDQTEGVVAAVAAAVPAQEEQDQTQYARVTASSLNVRAGAGTDHDKVGSLRCGTVVEILDQTQGWYQIESGYISAEYTVLVDQSEAAASSLGQEIANYALQFVGYPYVYGGSSPSGFDCSGFTSYVYRQFGYSLNRSAANQLDNGTPVSMSELQPGDLVLFKKAGTGSKRASHVGLYIGGGQFVHASTSTVGVIISNMTDAYYTTGFVGGRRIV